jgi:hypothetical protein
VTILAEVLLDEKRRRDKVNGHHAPTSQRPITRELEKNGGTGPGVAWCERGGEESGVQVGAP